MKVLITILLVVNWLKFNVFCDGMIDLQTYVFRMPRLLYIKFYIWCTQLTYNVGVL